MFKDPSMRGFLIHLAAFIVVMTELIVINLLTAPQHLWFIWVLAGWGIGLAAHDIALLLRKTRRRERIFIDPKARAFVIHLFTYVAVLLLLFVVNLTVTPQVWWCYWVLLGWGAGILAHGWCVFGRARVKRAPRREGARSSIADG